MATAYAYLRYPHVHDDLVVFCAADDVWLAPVTGGRAWRLTDDGAPVSCPRFSPDGSRVAWVSARDGHAEVMVIDTDGGTSERLTWLGSSSTSVIGWADDGRILVATDAGQGARRRSFVHALGLDGSLELLPYGPASGLAVHPGRAVALSTSGSRPPAHWKRYRGGTAPRLWLDRGGDGTWERLLRTYDAGLVAPNWIGDRLVFVSDHAATFPDRADEQADVWALDPPYTGDPVQITHHTPAEGYVRDLTGDGDRLVYHARGIVYRLDALDDRPVALDITVGGSLATRRRRALKPDEQLTSVQPDHGANASIVNWRGKTFHLAHREGPARALVAESGVRTREPRLLGQTGKTVLVCDADGDDRLEIHHLDGTAPPQILAAGALGRVTALSVNPAGTLAVACSRDGRVLLVELDSDRVREITRSTTGEATTACFSPDGRFAVWTQPTSPEGNHQLVGLALDDLDAGPLRLTSGRFSDHSPSFSQDGKYLLFLSARTFDPVYDRHGFDLAFTSALRPYLIPLSAVEPAPFGPRAEGWPITPADDDKSERAENEKPESAKIPPSPDWDVDGFEERIIAFPVPSGDYRDLQAAHDGVAWVHQAADLGVIGSARAGVPDEPADAVEFFSFAKRKLEVLVEKADSFAVSGDGKRIVVRDGGTVTVRPVDHPVKPDEPDLVTVDLERLRFDVDPQSEWRQMFAETVRLMTDNYWRADMNGVDWDAAVNRYRPALDRVASHDDLIDLLWEVIAELNTSHAYAIPAKEPGDLSRRLGLLGADLSPAGDGWRIDRILPGESSDPQARSPLRAAGVGATEGDVIVAVGGLPVDPRFGPAASLVGAADKPIELTIRSDGNDRRVVVVPLASEETLRYQDWVRGRAAYVDAHSDGRLGYVHVPDMMGVGWAQLHRDLRLAAQREGLIVDARYNRGGHVSELVIERLARRPVGWATARDVDLQEMYPTDAPRGPVVFVTNEMAGSDGDIVVAAAQAMGIGPVVGTRTWGGVIGVDGRFTLIDGTAVTQPRYAFWLQGKEWGVENHGVDPDIEVEIAPAEHLREHEVDRQLDRAIEEALTRLATEPAQLGPPLPPPRFGAGS